jgi:hypothetical protein
MNGRASLATVGQSNINSRRRGALATTHDLRRWRVVAGAEGEGFQPRGPSVYRTSNIDGDVWHVEAKGTTCGRLDVRRHDRRRAPDPTSHDASLAESEATWRGWEMPWRPGQVPLAFWRQQTARDTLRTQNHYRRPRITESKREDTLPLTRQEGSAAVNRNDRPVVRGFGVRSPGGPPILTCGNALRKIISGDSRDTKSLRCSLPPSPSRDIQGHQDSRR